MSKITFILIFILTFSTLVCADKGGIVPSEYVTLSEPAQRAIIAHDGFEEILILSTDVNATSPIKALFFLPLPSEPEVSLAPKDCFEKLDKLVKKHKLTYVTRTFYKGKGSIQPGKPVEVIMHKKLGAHDITVIKVDDAIHFRKWVNSYFKRKRLPRRNKYPEIEEIVTDYIKKGILYFVFDAVDLDKEVASINPLVYQFKTGLLYYPLRATNVIGGKGKIELFIFAESGRNYLKSTDSSPFNPRFKPSTTSVVMADELNDICPTINDLLGKRSILQAFKYDGFLSFKGDILESSPKGLLRIYY